MMRSASISCTTLAGRTPVLTSRAKSRKRATQPDVGTKGLLQTARSALVIAVVSFHPIHLGYTTATSNNNKQVVSPRGTRRSVLRRSPSAQSSAPSVTTPPPPRPKRFNLRDGVQDAMKTIKQMVDDKQVIASTIRYGSKYMTRSKNSGRQGTACCMRDMSPNTRTKTRETTVVVQSPRD